MDGARSWGVAPSAAVAMLGGVGLAVQGRINGQLGADLGDGVLAAVVSFVTGLLLLAVFVPAFPAGRRGLARLRAALRGARTGARPAAWPLRWWQCLGGVCGAFLVVTQGLTITSLGVAVFTVAVLGGQLTSGLVVDRAGIGPSGPRGVTWPRVLGAAVALFAVVLSVSGRAVSPEVLWLALLPAIGGIGLSWQQAVNGLVSRAAGNAFVASLVNFTVGAVALLVAAAVDVAVRGLPASAPREWWWYTGGSLGIFVIASAAMAVRAIGVLMVALCAVAGQLLGAVLLDVFVPATGEQLSARVAAGAAITLVAVAMAAMPAGRRFERMAP